VSFRKGINASEIENEILFQKKRLAWKARPMPRKIGKNVVVTQEELYLPLKWFVIKKEQTIL